MPSSKELPSRSRRHALGAGLFLLAAAEAGGWRAAQASGGEGAVGWMTPPQAVPALPVQLAEGGSLLLPRLLQGRVTAVQLVNTSASGSAAQGAAFGALAARLRGAALQLLSLGMDALGDTPQRLAAWQRPFGAHPSWRLGVPAAVDVDRLRDFFVGGPGRAGSAASRVFVIDGRGQLAWRSGDNPAQAELATTLNLVVRQG